PSPARELRGATVSGWWHPPDQRPRVTVAGASGMREQKSLALSRRRAYPQALEQPMDVDPSNDHPVLATGVPVAAVVGLHLAVSTALIAQADPDVPDLLSYWVASAL